MGLSHPHRTDTGSGFHSVKILEIRGQKSFLLAHALELIRALLSSPCLKLMGIGWM